MMKSNKTVPLEGAVKYLIKERDHYKEKLEQIVPYTKSLEQKLSDTESRHEKQVAVYKELVKNLKKENEALRKDYKKSDWFAGIDEERINLRRKVMELQGALNRLLVKERQDNKTD